MILSLVVLGVSSEVLAKPDSTPGAAGPVFLGYAVIGVLAFIFVKTQVPETKGRSLEQIEEKLQSDAGASRAPAGAR
jgi:MFS transporter, SP family, major inositol transporter